MWWLLKFVALDLGLSISSVLVGRAVGLRLGNASSAKMLRNSYLDSMALGAVIAPVLEELVFRGLPGLIVWLFCVPGMHWGWGILAATLFAIAHGFENDEGDTILPLPQFLGGLLLWYVLRVYGLGHCILLHGASNAVALTIAYIALGCS